MVENERMKHLKIKLADTLIFELAHLTWLRGLTP
jgi:hypothetical protein